MFRVSVYDIEHVHSGDTPERIHQCTKHVVGPACEEAERKPDLESQQHHEGHRIGEQDHSRDLRDAFLMIDLHNSYEGSE